MSFENVKLRDVTLRDGLQLTGGILPASEKAEIVRELISAGVDEIEIGSMARPDLVPPMANTLELVSLLTPEELERCWIWVATPKHVELAIEAGAKNFQYCFSATDSHNKANLGRTTEVSLEKLPEALELVNRVDGRMQLCIATSFTCPFEGETPIQRVVDIVKDPRTKGTCDVVVCDTIGQAIPSHVTELVKRVSEFADGRRIVYHGHDTWGLGVANALAAVTAGAEVVDGALGGLGGCPFAPGASGNSATEDLVFALRPSWLTPENYKQLVELGQKITERLGEENQSRSARGATASGASFAWALES